MRQFPHFLRASFAAFSFEGPVDFVAWMMLFKEFT